MYFSRFDCFPGCGIGRIATTQNFVPMAALIVGSHAYNLSSNRDCYCHDGNPMDPVDYGLVETVPNRSLGFGLTSLIDFAFTCFSDIALDRGNKSHHVRQKNNFLDENP